MHARGAGFTPPACCERRRLRLKRHPLGHTVSMGVIWAASVLSLPLASGMSPRRRPEWPPLPAADSYSRHALLARLAEESPPSISLPACCCHARRVKERAGLHPAPSEAVVAVALGDAGGHRAGRPFSKTEAQLLDGPPRVAAAAILDSLNAYQQTSRRRNRHVHEGRSSPRSNAGRLRIRCYKCRRGPAGLSTKVSAPLRLSNSAAAGGVAIQLMSH